MGGLQSVSLVFSTSCQSHRSQFDIELKETQLSWAFLLQINLVFQDIVGTEIVDS